MKIINILIIVTATLACSNVASLKAQAVEAGDHNLSFGYGMPTLNALAFKSFEKLPNYSVSGLGAMHFKYGVCVSDQIEIGVNANYSANSMSYTDEFSPGFNYVNTLSYSSLDINARMNVHFGRSYEFDPYVGFGVGYNNSSATWSSTNPDFIKLSSVSNFIPLGAELTVGGRYYFSQHVGFYAEVGYAQSIVQAGMVIQLY